MTDWFKRNPAKDQNGKSIKSDPILEVKSQLQDLCSEIQNLKTSFALTLQQESNQSQSELQQIKHQQQFHKEKLQAIRLDIEQLKAAEDEKTNKILDKLRQLRTITESGSDARENQSECKICMSGKIETCLIPCGHVFCKRCADRSKSSTGHGCPICRNAVLGIQNVYFP